MGVSAVTYADLTALEEDVWAAIVLAQRAERHAG
jgi:hypothetical protein